MAEGEGGVTERIKKGKEKLKMFPSATNLSNFLLLKAAPWTFSKDGRISAAAPRAPTPRLPRRHIKTSHAVMPLPLRPHRKKKN